MIGHVLAARWRLWWRRIRKVYHQVKKHVWGKGSRFFRRRAKHLMLGRLGESLCRQALTEIGVEVLCHNYRNRYGEIDIIGREGQELCFIEVKTRHRLRFGRPADAVDMKRRRRYARAAAKYMLGLNPDRKFPHRFDIMEVVFDGPHLSEITYLRRAFRVQRYGRIW